MVVRMAQAIGGCLLAIVVLALYACFYAFAGWLVSFVAVTAWGYVIPWWKVALTVWAVHFVVGLIRGSGAKSE